MGNLEAESMEQIARQEQEKMLEARVKELTFFKAKVPGTDVERFRLPDSLWLHVEMGKIKPKELEQDARERAEQLAGDSRDAVEMQIDALKISPDQADSTLPQLSSAFVGRAEQLPPHAQEAFIRGYRSFRVGNEAVRFEASIRDGDVKADQLPQDWDAMLEGNFMRTMEDSAIFGGSADEHVKRLEAVEEVTGRDILSRFKPQIEAYVERAQSWEQGHQGPLKPQSNGDFERRLKDVLNR